MKILLGPFYRSNIDQSKAQTPRKSLEAPSESVTQAAIKSDNSLKTEWCKMTKLLSQAPLTGVASFNTAVVGEKVLAKISFGPMHAHTIAHDFFTNAQGCEIADSNKGSTMEILISMDSVEKISEALKNVTIVGTKKPCFENGRVQKCDTPSQALMMALNHC